MINPRLRQLIDSGEFDWDNLHHRTAYLREWAVGRVWEEGAGGDDPVGLLEDSTESDPGDDARLLHQ